MQSGHLFLFILKLSYMLIKVNGCNAFLIFEHFQRETTFEMSCVLPQKRKSFQKGFIL